MEQMKGFKSGMTIEDFIKELQKYPNQKAEINFMGNFVNTDNEAYDIENCSVECFQQDCEDKEVYDIFLTRCLEEERKQDEKRDESISYLLSEHGKLTIELDNDPWTKESIVILDSNKNVLREIAVGGRFSQEDNICKILMFNM